ncbi:MAG: RHS repeat-associated core domain-containing protein [Flavobacteriales bacterium]
MEPRFWKHSYQDHGARIRHVYSYDNNMALTGVEVYEGAVGNVTQIGEVSYEYSTDFRMIRKELGGDLQGVDYTYLPDGKLKAVNSASLGYTHDPGNDGGTGSSFTTDLFGYELDYYEDDYYSDDYDFLSSLTTSFPGPENGMIGAVRYKTNHNYASNADYITKTSSSVQIIFNATDELMNRFTYDDYGRLANSTFSVYHNTSTASANTLTSYNDYKVFGTASSGTAIAYDDNGNITSLKRNGYDISSDLSMDYLGYTYTSGTNQLSAIIDNATISSGTYDTDLDAATSKAFTYDNCGRMITSAAEAVSDIDYYYTGLIKSISYTGGEQEDYFYDHQNRLLYTDFYNGINTQRTWYITSADGTVHEVLTHLSTENAAPSEYPLDGGKGREATYFVDLNETHYELTDHKGNVRVSFGLSSGNLTVFSWADYYPFGAPMPGRNYSMSSYRYNYRGEESTPLTAWTRLPLRQYNGLTGRFMTPDPARQEHNPYQYCANNPVNLSDPTGGLYLGAMVDMVAAVELAMFNLSCLGQSIKDYELKGLTIFELDGSAGGSGENHGENPQADEPTTSLEDAQASGLDGLEEENMGNTESDAQNGLDPDALTNIENKDLMAVLDGDGNMFTGMSEVNGEAGFDFANEEGVNESGEQQRGHEDGNEPKSFSHRLWGSIFGSDNDPSIDYDGGAWFGTNFIGPGPNKDPYTLGLNPKDAIDRSAQKHDYAYYRAGATGISGALFNKDVIQADGQLASDAFKIMQGYHKGSLDVVTGYPISERTYNMARAVYSTFTYTTTQKITDYSRFP